MLRHRRHFVPPQQLVRFKQPNFFRFYGIENFVVLRGAVRGQAFRLQSEIGTGHRQWRFFEAVRWSCLFLIFPSVSARTLSDRLEETAEEGF